ncbi:MAG TPA: zf-HC2 domain-containing protein [Candidatus Polarisedimenticolia bacterium]|nr:zf-HC2 domain-containing protein [Candidatus Polarisedimenticolia bacterium]
MIQCRTFVEFLMDYLEGELPPGQQDLFDQHLSVCTACVAYMKTYQEAVRMGKAVFRDLDAPVPKDVPEELVQAILTARTKGD